MNGGKPHPRPLSIAMERGSDLINIVMFEEHYGTSDKSPLSA
jgi:hypothetical protein